MTKVILYIAASMDGYIARKDHSLDWLPPAPDDDGDFGYKAFLAGIGTTLMGNNTYQVVKGFGEAVYPGLTNYVFSRTAHAPEDNITWVTKPPADFVRQLKATAQQHIWLIGGAEIIKALYEAELIDELILTQIPVLLGDGIPLWPASTREAKLELLELTDFGGGVVQGRYKL
jgi:dihydrofolate reductase